MIMIMIMINLLIFHFFQFGKHDFKITKKINQAATKLCQQDTIQRQCVPLIYRVH